MYEGFYCKRGKCDDAKKNTRMYIKHSTTILNHTDNIIIHIKPMNIAIIPFFFFFIHFRFSAFYQFDFEFII